MNDEKQEERYWVIQRIRSRDIVCDFSRQELLDSLRDGFPEREHAIIIKGRRVTPVAVRTVVEYDIE